MPFAPSHPFLKPNRRPRALGRESFAIPIYVKNYQVCQKYFLTTGPTGDISPQAVYVFQGLGG